MSTNRKKAAGRHIRHTKRERDVTCCRVLPASWLPLVIVLLFLLYETVSGFLPSHNQHSIAAVPSKQLPFHAVSGPCRNAPGDRFLCVIGGSLTPQDSPPNINVPPITATTTTITTTTTTIATNIEVDPTTALSPDIRYKIQSLMDQRAKARWEGDYERADQLKQQLVSMELELPAQFPASGKLELWLQDIPRSQGGGSIWKLHWNVAGPANDQHHKCESTSNVLQLAHTALGLAVSYSDTTTTMQVPSFDSSAEKQKQLDGLVTQAKQPLREWKAFQEQIALSRKKSDEYNFDTANTTALDSYTGWSAVEQTLGGRKSADAAFWFALAGVVDKELYELLACVCTKELHRFGTKPTCRAKDILQMMDRFAAAGIRSGSGTQVSVALEEIAQQCLKSKQRQQSAKHASSGTTQPTFARPEELLDLHSDRCLLMLWKFSARQKKQLSFLQSAQLHWQQQKLLQHDHLVLFNKDHDPNEASMSFWEDCFGDPTRPLVIDIGCGMGISLLGLASFAKDPTAISSYTVLQGPDGHSFADCNFVGVDLSGLAIGYAQGLARRWGLSDRLHFEVDTAQNLLEKVIQSYPGPVSLCLIQFPTPYRLQQQQRDPSESIGDRNECLSSSGNSQLPKSALDGFMVSPTLLKVAHTALSKSNNKKTRWNWKNNCTWQAPIAVKL